MPRILAMGTALPAYRLDAPAFQQALVTAFAPFYDDVRPLLRMAERCGVRERYIAMPPELVLVPRSLDERNRLYQQQAVGLGEQAALRALDAAGVLPAAIDIIITVSCTGYMLPSLDAHLAVRLGLRSDVRRLPITELGCLAGASAFARGADLLRAGRRATALVVAAEFPSLTFQPGDGSMDNLVSTLVFADGAGAAVLAGDAGPGIEIVASRSVLLPGTLAEMGFDLRESGFHVVLSKNVPGLLAEPFAGAARGLLAEHGLTIRDLGFACIHPGGPKILRAVDAALQVEGLTAPSWSVLERFGNQSSAAVFFIMDELLQNTPPRPGTFGLLAGFGPGLSLELCLLRQHV
jgi:alkylresorcinol/alkylpyrone synthase